MTVRTGNERAIYDARIDALCQKLRYGRSLSDVRLTIMERELGIGGPRRGVSVDAGKPVNQE